MNKRYGIFLAAQILWIALKLTGVITFSWWWVFWPVYAWVIILAVILFMWAFVMNSKSIWR